MTARRLQVNAAERYEFARLCRRARAPRPALATPAPLTSRLYQSCWERTWHFPTATAANAWNHAWEEWLEGAGEPHPGILHIGGRPIADPLKSMVARIAANLLFEEASAGAPYPVALPGGRLELAIGHGYYTSSLSWARDSLTVTLRGGPFPSFGDEPLWLLDVAREYPLELLPGDLAERLTAARWEPTDEIFG